MQSLLALALMMQAPAADTTQVREGLYLGFSLGPAVVGTSCAECSGTSGSELALQLNAGVGAVVSPHLTVGLQFEGWRHQESENGLRAVEAVMTWYPNLASGAFLRPSIGTATFIGDQIVDGPTEKGSGLIAGLTIGHDIRIDRKLSFTPTMTIQYADIGDTSQGGFTQRTDLSAWMVGLGIGLTWH